MNSPPAGTTPVVGHVLAWSGTEIRLVAPPSGGGAGLAIGDTPPASPGLFPFWFDTVRGMLMVWYNDGNSIQWIPSATGASGPPGPAGNGTLNGARVPLATDGRAGDFWINTLDWVTYGPKGVDGTWPLGVAMRRGGMALTIAGERVQITGFNVEMS